MCHGSTAAAGRCCFSVKWRAGAAPLASITPFSSGNSCTAQLSGGRAERAATETATGFKEEVAGKESRRSWRTDLC